jgi:putative N6-adenine-specific DNA methylase
MKNTQYVAKTLAGLEQVLADELKELGASSVSVNRRSVYFEADDLLIYKANLYLRTALFVLKPLKKGKVTDKDSLYQLASTINWEEIFGPDKSLVIHAISNSEQLRHSKYTALVVKDAIVDRFRERFGLRPSVDRENADIHIDVHLIDNFCTISLNTSGKPLFIRGYEKQTGEAPINDLLAAGIIKMSGWRYDQALYDPFCGSGTILIEAAMQAANIPAGIHRQGFSFMNTLNFNRKKWKELLEEAKAHITTPSLNIYGSELDSQTFKKLESNIRRSRLTEYIKVKNEDFFNSKYRQQNGVIITNPPYGERLKLDDIEEFYYELGKRLKFEFYHNKTHIVTGSKAGLRRLGFRYDKKENLINGKIPVDLISFMIFPDRKEQD